MGKPLEADGRKWRRLMDYMKHWPYSPYYDIEQRALLQTIREIREGKEDLTDEGSASD